jgi:hypothetical protein
MKEEKSIEETLTDLQELLTMQDKALKTAQQLIFLKSSLVEILEKQKALQIQETNVYKYCFFGLLVFDVLLFITSLIHAS